MVLESKFLDCQTDSMQKNLLARIAVPIKSPKKQNRCKEMATPNLIITRSLNKGGKIFIFTNINLQSNKTVK